MKGFARPSIKVLNTGSMIFLLLLHIKFFLLENNIHPFWVKALSYLWLGSTRTRRRRRVRFRTVGAWQSCAARGLCPDSSVQLSGSSDQTPSSASGCGCDQRGSSRAPAERHFGTVLLQCTEQQVYQLLSSFGNYGYFWKL